MKISRWLSLGLGIGLLLWVAASCGDGVPCGPATCFGCCDATGSCQTGMELTRCGSNGATCNLCAATQSCQLGVCLNGGGGGGSGGGGGGGGGGAGGGGSYGDDGGSDGGADAGFDAGVSTPTNPLDFTAIIIPDPPRLGSNTVDVIIRGANGIPVTGATLTAKTWMPSMGHGSATPTVAENGGGEYLVSGVKFTMQGTWQLILNASAPGGLSGAKTLSYTVK